MSSELAQSHCGCNSDPCGHSVEKQCPTCGRHEDMYDQFERMGLQDMPRNIALLDFWGWAGRHPIIGSYPEMAPADPNRRSLATILAFSVWAAQGEVVTLIPGHGKSELTLGLAKEKSVNVDLAKMWNWQPAAFKDWLRDLNSANLIDDALYASALQGLGHSARGRIPLTREMRLAVIEKTHGHCVYCGCRLTLTNGYANSYHADHVLPVTKGGTNDIGNLVPACANCNSRKSAKTTLVFMSPLS